MSPKAASKLCAAVLLLAPAGASASVQITEIMYDVSGSDAGREWVEVTNAGAGPADLSAYKFFEANANHALVLAGGAGVLPPGASAVIAQDPAKFKADWPFYFGALFDSSFSLSNSGETLAIKNAALAVEDSVTYQSSAGASGDGESLQRSASGWVAAAPTPGSSAVGAIKTASASAPAAPAATQMAAPSSKSAPAQSAKTVSTKADKPAPQAAAAERAAPAPSGTDALWPSLAGLAVLLAAGVAAVRFARPGAAAETNPAPEEFEIE